MVRIALLAFIVLILGACGSKSADTAASADAKPAEQPAAARQKTVFDDQLKALDKAKAVEKQLQEDKEKRDKAMDAQEQGG
jgi:ABC-type enterochelin transport system substrate-binding protein